jgi:hypothetical protein
VTDLTTIESVKQYLGKTDVADDGVLAALITSYSDWVRSFTNRDFTAASYDIWRNGRGGDTLWLPQWPVTGVALLEIEGVAIPAAPAWGAYGYRATDRAITLSGGIKFPLGTNNVRVQFSAGYAEVPDDIAQAVNELVALRYRMRDKLEWTSKSLAGETVSLNTRDMPASVATVLKQYANLVPL